MSDNNGTPPNGTQPPAQQALVRVAPLDRIARQEAEQRKLNPEALCRLVLQPLGVQALQQSSPEHGAVLAFTVLVPQSLVPLVDPLLGPDGQRALRMEPIKAAYVEIILRRQTLPGQIQAQLAEARGLEDSYKVAWLGLVRGIQGLIREEADKLEAGDPAGDVGRVLALDQILEAHGVDPVTGESHAIPATVIDGGGAVPEGAPTESPPRARLHVLAEPKDE